MELGDNVVLTRIRLQSILPAESQSLDILEALWTIIWFIFNMGLQAYEVQPQKHIISRRL